MKHFLALLVLSPILLAPVAAYAADEQAPRRWLDQHKHPHGPGMYDKTDGATSSGTKVYGWSSRAPGTRVYGWRHCGDYHYWNGSTCVDARDTPP
jgi:hypothetical protein